MGDNIKLTVFYDHIINAAKQENCSIEDIAARIKEAGISGTEMDYWMLKEEGDELAYRLKEWGIPITSSYLVLDLANNPDDDRYIEALERLNRLEIRYMLIVPGFSDNQSSERLLAAQENMLPGIKRLAKMGQDMGIKVTMEDYDDVSAAFSTHKQVKWFLDRVKELGCAFDTGNFLYSEEDVLEAYDALKDRIEYVHLKDRSLKECPGEDYKATIKGRKMYSAAVGNGIIPMKEILLKLKNDGYFDKKGEKIFAIEHFGSLNQLQDMLDSASFVTRVLKNS